MSVKQMIVLRTDLNMRKGKMVSQGAHASMKVFLDRAPGDKRDLCLRIHIWPAALEWVEGLFTKITVGVDSEQGLLDLERQAKEAGIPCALIQDSGLTEFKGIPTYTALAIGPAEAADLEPITGGLKLL